MTSRLRKLAQGKPCQIRLVGVCNFDESTTVLAHFPLAGYTGMGMKSPDLIGGWACSKCHDEVDRRTRLIENTETVRLAHAEGVLRTIAELEKMGAISAS